MSSAKVFTLRDLVTSARKGMARWPKREPNSRLVRASTSGIEATDPGP